jgi:hypothetical protein
LALPAPTVVKLGGNFLITAVIEGLAEAMALVRKSGLDVRTFLDLVTGTLFLEGHGLGVQPASRDDSMSSGAMVCRWRRARPSATWTNMDLQGPTRTPLPLATSVSIRLSLSCARHARLPLSLSGKN